MVKTQHSGPLCAQVEVNDTNYEAITSGLEKDYLDWYLLTQARIAALLQPQDNPQRPSDRALHTGCLWVCIKAHCPMLLNMVRD